MTGEKISQLPSASSVAPADVTVIVQGGVTKQTPISNFARTKLATLTQFYIRTDGSDSNAGNANTAGAAWLTLQHAGDVLMNQYDLNGNDAFVNVADGTYPAGLLIEGPWTGSGTVLFQGNTVTPANCVVSVSNANAIHITTGARLFIQGFGPRTSGSGNGLLADESSTLLVNAMDYGACADSQIAAGVNSYVQLGANYTISGSATSHFHAGTEGSNITVSPGVTSTFTADVTYSAYFCGVNRGSVDATSLIVNTNGHTVTGTKFVVHYNGTLITEGHALNYLPGTVDGTWDNNGVVVSNQGAIYDIQQAPQNYTPTVTAGSGTFTTVSASVDYKIDGIMVDNVGLVTCTSIGSASGLINVPTANLINPVKTTPLYGFNIDSGNPVSGYIDGGGGTFHLFPAVAFPTNGQRIVFFCRVMKPPTQS